MLRVFTPYPRATARARILARVFLKAEITRLRMRISCCLEPVELKMLNSKNITKHSAMQRENIAVTK
jgi:hypothetical protein